MKAIRITVILLALFFSKETYSQMQQTSMRATSGMYGLSGRMKAKKGKGNELAAILLQASKLVSPAKGIHLYVVSTDVADPDTIWIMEAWDSKTDHDQSLQLPGVKELITQAMPLIEGSPEGIVLDVLGGKGVD